MKPEGEASNTTPLFEVRAPSAPPATTNTSQGADISSLTAGSDNIFLGTSTGQVHVVNAAFKVVRTFATYEQDYDNRGGAITHLKQVEGTSLLITICEDLSSEPVLKVWALDELDKKTGAPTCKSTLTVNNGRKQFPVCRLAPRPRCGADRGGRYLHSPLHHLSRSAQSGSRMGQSR